MKTFWSVVLAVWATGWISVAAVRVGDSFNGGVYTWHIPFNIALMCLFPALLGYLIGKEKNNG